MIIPTVLNHIYLEDEDIHKFFFKESSRLAMDEYMQLLRDLHEDYIKDRADLLIILDIQESGMLPVKYAAAMMEKLFKDLAPFPRVYIAYLSDDASDKSLIGIMDYTASSNVNRVQFPVNGHDQAIEWLLAKRATPA